MIGQNDIRGEIFTVADAKTLVGFAAANHLGRLSMWSINRDSQCGTSFPVTGQLSNTCSGTAQTGLQFAQTFSNGLPYQAKWSNQGVSPATQSTDASGSPWKALYSIPGEPAGSPALG